MNAGFNRSFHQRIIIKGGQHDHFRPKWHDLTRRRNPIKHWHPNIQHSHIDVVLFHLLHRILTISSGGHHLKIRLCVQDGGEGVEEERLIVGKQNAHLILPALR